MEPAEELIQQLPPTTAYELLIRYPRPDDYIDFASRGFFAYDWQDVHGAPCTYAYELIASPTTPVRVEQLSPDIARAAKLVIFGDLSFAITKSLPVERFIACKAG